MKRNFAYISWAFLSPSCLHEKRIVCSRQWDDSHEWHLYIWFLYTSESMKAVKGILCECPHIYFIFYKHIHIWFRDTSSCSLHDEMGTWQTLKKQKSGKYLMLQPWVVILFLLTIGHVTSESHDIYNLYFTHLICGDEYQTWLTYKVYIFLLLWNIIIAFQVQRFSYSLLRLLEFLFCFYRLNHQLKYILFVYFTFPSNPSFYVYSKVKAEYLVIALVHLGCHNEHRRLNVLKNKHLFLIVLESGSPRWGHQGSWVLVRGSFQITDWQVLLVLTHQK